MGHCWREFDKAFNTYRKGNATASAAAVAKTACLDAVKCEGRSPAFQRQLLEMHSDGLNPSLSFQKKRERSHEFLNACKSMRENPVAERWRGVVQWIGPFLIFTSVLLLSTGLLLRNARGPTDSRKRYDPVVVWSLVGFGIGAFVLGVILWAMGFT